MVRLETLSPGQSVVVFASGNGTTDLGGNLHTNFGLSADGGTLSLANPSSVIVSQFGSAGTDYPSQRTDVSYGIDPTVSGSDNLRYFINPTPGTDNNAGVVGFVDDTRFSVDRGYFDSSFSVDITSETAGATLVYTTDGSPPKLGNGTAVFAGNNASPVATVTVSGTTTLRAAAFRSDLVSTNIDTQTYLFLSDVVSQTKASALAAGFPNSWGDAPLVDYGVDPDITGDSAYSADFLAGLRELPALSIATDVEDLFGSGGIYSNPTSQSLEAAVSAEYILPDGSTGFQIDAGLRISGGASRIPDRSPKHSMSLRFREIYGDTKLRYDLFDNPSHDEFNSLQLRAMYNNSWIHNNGSQRNRATLIRDQFIRDSFIAMGQDDGLRGDYAHPYLNGLYWGVFNIHERPDSDHYAEYNGGIDDNLDAINGGNVTDGTIDSWNALKAAASAQNWAEIKQRLDVDNFIDWFIVNAYGGNTDFKTGGN